MAAWCMVIGEAGMTAHQVTIGCRMKGVEAMGESVSEMLGRKLHEPSTWKGLGWILVAAGIMPVGAVEVVASAGIGLIGLVEVLRRER